MKSKYVFTGDFGSKNINVKVGLDIISFKEDDTRIVYSPALDLSGYGDNEAEAKKSFENALAEFLRYTINKNTLHAELISLGWKVDKRKREKLYEPPYLDKLLQEREYLTDIVRNKPFRRTTKQVDMPVLA